MIMDWLEAEALLKQLINLYREKQILLEDMLRITLACNELSNNERFDELSEILESRQGRIDKVDLIDPEIAKLSRCLKESEDDQIKMPETLSGICDEIRERRQDCFNLVQNIRSVDGQTRSRLDAHLAALKKQGEEIITGRRTVNAYRTRTPQGDSLFIDKRK